MSDEYFDERDDLIWATCSECGREFETPYWYVEDCENSGDPIVCANCSFDEDLP